MCYLDFLSVPYKIYVCDKNNFKIFSWRRDRRWLSREVLALQVQRTGFDPSEHTCMYVCVYTYVRVYITFINNNINILFFKNRPFMEISKSLLQNEQSVFQVV